MRPASHISNQTNATHSSQNEKPQSTLVAFFADFVQDIAKRHQKEAVLETHGLDYFDRHPQQLAIWKDVIIQLLRNAVVHGLETPSERSNLLKSRQGTVKLSIEQTPEGKMRLLVEDDGHGIDFTKIRQKAIQKGLASAEEASQWNNSELLHLIFSPGFSTREQSDEDAGRGVGMDIVKERITEHHAKLKVRTATQQFTRFIIDL